MTGEAADTHELAEVRRLVATEIRPMLQSALGELRDMAVRGGTANPHSTMAAIRVLDARSEAVERIFQRILRGSSPSLEMESLARGDGVKHGNIVHFTKSQPSRMEKPMNTQTRTCADCKGAFPITLCPLHGAAEQMLAALEAMSQAFAPFVEGDGIDTGLVSAWEQARAAIKAARNE